MAKIHILKLVHEETDSDSQTYMVTSRILRLLWYKLVLVMLDSAMVVFVKQRYFHRVRAIVL